MRNLILLFVLILTSSCASYVQHVTGRDNEFSNNFTLTQTGPSLWDASGKIKIKYKTFNEIKTEYENKIQNEMLNEKEANELLASIPHGGYIVVYIFRATIDLANTDNFIYVIQKNGNEIYRENPKRNIPSVPSHSGADGHWWTNIDIISLISFDKNDEFKIFVIDKTSNVRDEFTIKHKEVSSLSRKQYP